MSIRGNFAKMLSYFRSNLQQSVESKVATTTAFKEIVPTVFECDVRCCDEAGSREVDRRLEAVLARLVSDYRAIFVIEEEVEGGARFVFTLYVYLDASRYF